LPLVRIGVLASGTGTNLEAILEARLPVVVVLADRACRALEVAQDAGVTSVLVERTSFGASFDRLAYTHEVIDALEAAGVELVAMAGFMTILDKPFVDRWPGRILNTHPSLLPSFPGAHGVRDALDAGVKITGCTVHIATAELDAGPIVAQTAVEVLPDDTVESLHERVKAAERVLYPAAIQRFMRSDAETGVA
jgi:formyltetrahydrofolate-dependent phosphoribosylglycinamide formyltransferase